LPVHMSVCYKRCMRKWMKDRIKRRPKRGSDSTEQAKAPEPLQPKYFEADVGERAAPVIETPPAPEPEPEAPPEIEGQAEMLPELRAKARESGARPIRRRRRRGGRGSGQRTPAKVAAGSPPDSIAPAAPDAAAETASVAAVEAPPVSSDVVAIPIEPVSPDTVVAELPPTAPVAAAPRPSKGVVVLAIGLPGSGKSSWFKRHNIRPLSSDLLRELLFDDAEEQRFQDLVFSNLRSMLKARLIARRPVSYVDATNLTPHDRHSWIKLAKDYGYDVQGLFFDVPLEVCLERHARRGRVVPEDIMRRMAAKLKPPTFEEGFSKLTVVRVKKKE
jgi:predicted kinase